MFNLLASTWAYSAKINAKIEASTVIFLKNSNSPPFI